MAVLTQEFTEVLNALRYLIKSIDPKGIKYVDGFGPSIGSITIPKDGPVYDACKVLEKYKDF